MGDVRGVEVGGEVIGKGCIYIRVVIIRIGVVFCSFNLFFARLIIRIELNKVGLSK